MQADIGLIGLAVMGQNLVLNMIDHGFLVAVYNRTVEKGEEFVAKEGRAKPLFLAKDLLHLVQNLARPRKIMMMVKAGAAVDELIEALLPHLEAGDILIDGGNSHFPDTERRVKALEAKGILFLGVGISGGEEGARHGPSIMPGGNPKAWPSVKPILQKIAAHVDGDPCCDWVGSGGAGHFVKMVHNGIEYGDMQLIAEGFDLLHTGARFSYEELSSLFAKWNRGKLSSYLIEISSKIFQKKEKGGGYLLDAILDVAGQKGTGKWTGIDAMERGIPLTLIAEAVFARYLSSLLAARKETSRLYKGSTLPSSCSKEKWALLVEEALYAAKILSYAQGFLLLQEASKEYGWNLQMGAIALMWRGGCIIRSTLLGKMRDAFTKNPNLSSLLVDPFFASQIQAAEKSWRECLQEGIGAGIATPCLSAALSFFDGYRRARLPANLLQAQRDFFGAHTYERVDQPRGKFFHTEWV